MRKMRTISNLEYKRRYFNEVLCEAFAMLHMRACEIKPGDTTPTGTSYSSLYESSKKFFRDEMNLDTSTVASTRKSILENAPYFTKIILEEAEEMAEDKAVIVASEKELPIPEDPEMSEEDKEVMNAVFASKLDEDDVETISKATATALFAENKKAEEMKKALDIIENEELNKNVLKEATDRLVNIGPTSLMDAILHAISENVVRSTITENATSVGNIIKSNKDAIKNEACYVYSLYETMSVFGFKSYSSNDLELLSKNIYMNK